MPEEQNARIKWLKKLKNKYRLVVMNDDTFEEKLSFRLSRLNVFIAIGSVSILLIFATTYIIAFTPLREYIPGYTNMKLSKESYINALKVDSLKQEVKSREVYLNNIKMIMEGKVITDPASKQTKDTSIKYNTITIKKSKEDSILRKQIESENKYDLSSQDLTMDATDLPNINTSISNFFYFTPLKGIVINGFDAVKQHYGVDIAGKKDDIIKSVLDGTVIFSNWTLETGYIIGIQHQHNLISVYKHNSALLKKAGDYVKAGDPIAFIGNSGELSSGPHLHFELWYNGNPVNPKDYISF
ncbi:MAG: M23 family metallopeptidase [Bacteroidetes bacterium]|nr:M23 family metallopeptidase [Bacteroidota bacterium]